MSKRALGTLGAIALTAGLLSGCASGSHQAATPITVFNLAADPAQQIPAPDPKRPPLTAAALRRAFDTLLSEHVTLVAALAHAVDTGNGDATPTDAVKALAANTQALTDALASVYGRDAARAFAQLWEQHTQFFIDYAQSARTNDSAGKALAKSQLHDYQSDFASFVTTATAGGVELVAVTNLLHTHVDDITSYVDADVSGSLGGGRRAAAARGHAYAPDRPGDCRRDRRAASEDRHLVGSRHRTPWLRT